MAVSSPQPPQWARDMTSPPPPNSKGHNIPDPPGYAAPATVSKKSSKSAPQQQPARKQPTSEEMDTLKMKKAWEIAIAPAKSLPMNAIGMYMTGNSLQIFSIMMVLMLFKTPIQAILNTNSNFTRFETEGTRNRLVAVKLVYILMNFMAMGLGIWKIDKMGLLPTTRSDWLAWESQRQALERAYPAFSA